MLGDLTTIQVKGMYNAMLTPEIIVLNVLVIVISALYTISNYLGA